MMHMIVNVFAILHAVAGLRSCKGIKEEELYAENVAHNLLCSYIKYSKGIMTIVIISMDTELYYVGRIRIIAEALAAPTPSAKCMENLIQIGLFFCL